MRSETDSTPMDAVITWVDGRRPAHRARRAQYMAQNARPLGENARNPHRWEQSDEILYCLRSIHTHAPWLRRIWIVVEEEGPDLSSLPEALRRAVFVVTHAQIFAGFEDVLPTFNSLSIESMMWRIEGLAERFLYFNDDVFLTAALAPADVFRGRAPVLRGGWVDHTALLADPALRADPAQFNRLVQINAGALCGYAPARVFAAAHVVHPTRRSVMARLFARHRRAFERNIAHRFRDPGQFSPQGLHAHACIAAGEAVIQSARDHLHIRSGQGAGAPGEQTRALLTASALAGVKFLCVNDLPQLEALVPDARALISRAVG